MKTVEELYDRFKNLQEIKKIEQVNIIQAGFDEHDLESLLYWLGILKHMMGVITVGEGSKQ